MDAADVGLIRPRPPGRGRVIMPSDQAFDATAVFDLELAGRTAAASGVATAILRAFAGLSADYAPRRHIGLGLNFFGCGSGAGAVIARITEMAVAQGHRLTSARQREWEMAAA